MGLLQVLLLVLSKRYRVDYGAHPAGVRRMAVPYRAKDAAAERAEFGHPDVAMMLSILTCACWCFSRLRKPQIYQLSRWQESL